MRKVPVYYVGILCIVAAGAFVRPERRLLSGPISLSLPYQIGTYTGRDLAASQAVAEIHGWPREAFVLRDFINPQGNRVELYAARGMVGQLTGCFKYAGWIVNYQRGTVLDLGRRLEARELIALSPEGQPDEADACLAYVRAEDRTFSSNPMELAFQNKLAVWSGLENRAISVRICTEVGDWKERLQSEVAFAELRSFSGLLDPFLEKALAKNPADSALNVPREPWPFE